VVGFFEDVATSWRNGAASWKQDESTFLGSARAWDENLKGRGAFSPEVWNAQGTAAEKGLQFMNTLTRIPMKFLGATDDFYKTLAAHQFVRQEAMVEAVTKHGMLDGREIADYVSRTVDSHMLRNTRDGTASMYTEKGLVAQGLKEMKHRGIEPTDGADQTKALYKYMEDNKRSVSETRLAEAATKYAKDVTFTKELEGPVGSRVSGLVNTLPLPMKFVVPFLRTPWNILGFGLSRNPLGAGAEQLYKTVKGQAGSWKDVMENGTGREIVELKGRLSASVGYTSALAWYVFSNGDKISGYGPENKEEREALRATGWQPYSVRVGDKWISYQRVDPLTTMLGVVADIKDAMSYNDELEGSESIFSALSVSVAFNLTDRSYLRGFNNLLNVARDPGTYFPKLGKDIAAGFVPNILNKTQDTGFFNDDEGRRMIRETRGVADAMLRRIPGAGENIPPKRTVLGDPVYRDNVLGVLEPFNFAQVSRTSKSLVDNEIANLRHGFTKPEKNFRGIPELNLTEIYNSQGRQAYDRWLELSSEVKINGRTLRQALKKLFQSSGYKSIPEHIPHEQTGKKTPRVGFANKVIRAYRTRAQYQMLKEFPELVKGFKDARKLYYEQATQGNPIPTP
jgi:hypothetical protein